MEGHVHLGAMWALDILAVILLFHFVARAWSGLKPDNPALRGLNFVA